MRVRYVSACMDASGYAEAARNHIVALSESGVKVDVKPVSFERYRSDLGMLGAKVANLISDNNSAKIQILHLTPENYRHLIDENKYNIGYAAWETSKLPDTWVGKINQLDEVWVPCQHNKECFLSSGVQIPVQVMPHPFKQEYGQGTETKNVIANTADDEFVFYSIFQWTERKNPSGLLRAYLTEFKPHEKVSLVLKTYLVNPENPGEATKIKSTIREIKSRLYIKDFPKMLLISKLLSREQISSLHTEGDCYVNLHRCEGFGIPLVEAMLHEKPVITTTYGGPQDFITTDTGYPVPYIMTPCYGMPWNTYTGHMEWAEPDIMAARRQMREVFENQKAAKQKGKAARKFVQENLSWEAIGQLMKNRIEEIEATL